MEKHNFKTLKAYMLFKDFISIYFIISYLYSGYEWSYIISGVLWRLNKYILHIYTELGCCPGQWAFKNTGYIHKIE